MFAPSVIAEADGSYSLYIGSGDREKPLGSAYFPHTSAVANYFFKVKDKPSDAAWLSAESAVNCPGQSLICLASLASAGSVNGQCGAATAPTGKGWILGLRATEKVVTPAATRFGVTTFSTHMPAVPVPGACTSNLGTTHVYNLTLATAKPVAGLTCDAVVTGGGLPPPPEKIDVCMNSDCTTKKSICIGCSTDSPIQSQENGIPANLLKQNAKRRVYWYIQK
jgi:type IV pilus assembly protein PilY1